METYNGNIPFPTFSYNQYVIDTAKNFCSSNYGIGSSFDYYQSGKSRVDSELDCFFSKEHKIQFIGYCINYINESVAKHMKKCNGCSYEKDSIKILYYFYGKLDDLDIKTDLDSFSKDEVYLNNEIINKIISKLDEIKAGQDFTYDEILLLERAKEDLEGVKYLTPLGKKIYQMQVKGFIATYIATKILDNIIALAISHDLNQLLDSANQIFLS